MHVGEEGSAGLAMVVERLASMDNAGFDFMDSGSEECESERSEWVSRALH
jgi:hypothetical protein